jgi:hypothetical protein
VSAQAAVRGTSAPTRARRSVLPGVSAVVGLAAIAAGAFFVVRTVRTTREASAASIAAASPAANAANANGGAVANAPAPGRPADPGVDPLSLPKETASGSAHRAAHAWHGHGAQTLVAKADPKEQEEAAPAAPKAQAAAKEASPPTPPPPANNALFNSMKLAAASAPSPAAPPPEAAEVAPVPAAANVGPSAGSGTGAAQHPSQGQVTGALRAVLPAASACLGDDDGVSRAHVVFGSDGNVQSVSISGFSYGKPSEGCIKVALGKAHVPPFAEASYGATVTVRP